MRMLRLSLHEKLRHRGAATSNGPGAPGARSRSCQELGACKLQSRYHGVGQAQTPNDAMVFGTRKLADRGEVPRGTRPSDSHPPSMARRGAILTPHGPSARDAMEGQMPQEPAKEMTLKCRRLRLNITALGVAVLRIGVGAHPFADYDGAIRPALFPLHKIPDRNGAIRNRQRQHAAPGQGQSLRVQGHHMHHSL